MTEVGNDDIKEGIYDDELADERKGTQNTNLGQGLREKFSLASLGKKRGKVKVTCPRPCVVFHLSLF